MQYHVGYQGEPGAFSEIAVQRMVSKALLVPFRSFPELFQAIVSGYIDYGVVAIENSLAGSVRENYDLFLEYTDLVTILEEATVQIIHNLIALPGVNFSEIHRVYSHPMALLQCRRFLQQYQNEIEAVPDYDTAGSVKVVVEGRMGSCAAIASASCAEIYGGSILCENIGDSTENYTRFFLVARRNRQDLAARHKLGDKTSIVFKIKNEPGQLARCLDLFARQKINLTKIESRPTGDPWQYFFYLDFLGNPTDPTVKTVLDSLKNATVARYILGCYTAAKK